MLLNRILTIVTTITVITTMMIVSNEEKLNDTIEEPVPTIVEIVEMEPIVEEETEEIIWTTTTVTAYCACTKCCGPNAQGITASGKRVQANHTIAMPSKYDFGTQIEIKGYGIYTVEDRGSAIQGDRIDIYFDSHQEALNFGKQQLEFRIVL